MSPLEVALRRPIMVIMLFLIPITLGLIAFPRLPISRFPRTNFPFVQIQVAYPGASPTDVERQITELIEDSVVGIAGTQHITSNSTQGSAQVFIQFSEDTDQVQAQVAVERRINSLRRRLPAGAGEPSINSSGGDMFPIMVVSLSSDRLSSQELYELVNDEIAPSIQELSGVADASVSGGVQPQIQIRVDPARLQSHGVSLTQIRNALANWNISSPAGVTRTDALVFNTRTLAIAQTLADLENIVIATPAGVGAGAATAAQTVFLKDVARIAPATQLQTSFQRLDGREAVGLRVTQASDANSLEVSARVREKISQVLDSYGKSAGLVGTITSEQAKFTRAAVDDTSRSLYLAVLFAGLVLVLFLHNLRNTFIVLIAIPTSLLPTFFVMYLMGLSLDTISLMGLALVIGILVDDSIVVIENINRHLSLGLSPWDAARKGLGEIGMAAVAITFTNIAVFVPLAFTPGNVGRLFRELGIVMAVATFFSLLVSLILTPMLASRLLKPGEENATGGGPWGAFSRGWERGFDVLRRGYRKLLSGSLRVRWLPVLTGFSMLAMLIIAVQVRIVGSEYVPREDNNQFSVNIEMPPGTSFATTDSAVRLLEQRLARLPEVKAVSASAGGRAGREQNGSLDVDLVDRSERSRSVFEVVNDVRGMASDIPGAQLRTGVPSPLGGGMGGGGLQIIARGPDDKQLQAIAQQVVQLLRQIPGTAEARTASSVPAPEYRAVIDPQKAADLGVNPNTVSTTLSAAVGGALVTQFRPEGLAQTEVWLLLEGAERLTPAQLGAIPITTNRNTTIRLDQVASILPGTGPAQISRYDRQRQVQISAAVTDRPLGEVINDVQAQMARLELPVGYNLQISGQGSQLNAAFAALAAAMALSVVFMFMVLAALYESLIYPWAVVLCLPVALVGAFLGLLLTGNTINIFSMMGMILLVGLVAKNAILLVDYTNTLRSRGMSRTEAILEAGPTRLRPIMMTTMSVVCALMPLAFKFGAGSESRAPLAVAVIGGILTSTLLTLVMVPCAYTYLDDFQKGLLTLGARLRALRAAGAARRVAEPEPVPVLPPRPRPVPVGTGPAVSTPSGGPSAGPEPAGV